MRDAFKKLHNFKMGVKEDTPRPEFNSIPRSRKDEILEVVNDKSRVTHFQAILTDEVNFFAIVEPFSGEKLKGYDLVYNTNTSEMLWAHKIHLSQGLVTHVKFLRGVFSMEAKILPHHSLIVISNIVR